MTARRRAGAVCCQMPMDERLTLHAPARRHLLLGLFSPTTGHHSCRALWLGGEMTLSWRLMPPRATPFSAK